MKSVRSADYATGEKTTNKERRETKRRRAIDYIRRVPITISQGTESFFYQLGLKIANRPGFWLICCTLVVLCCLAGLLRFRQEKNPIKLWIPPDSDFVRDTEWLFENFGEGVRTQTILVTGNDVLEPRVFRKLHEITKRIAIARGQDARNTTWEDVCVRVPKVTVRLRRTARNVESTALLEDLGGNESDWISTMTYVYCKVFDTFPKECYTTSLLDLFDYDDEKIDNLTKEEILDALNRTTVSPTLGHPMNYTELLGGIRRDENGTIIGASAMRSQWFTRVNFSAVDMNKIGNDVGTADWATEDVLAWENAFLLESRNEEKDPATTKEPGSYEIMYKSARSFGDVTASTMFNDIGKLIIGILLMSVYVQLILSRFNWVEYRVCLTTAGLLCVGGAFIIAVGVCSLVGVPYGPVHSALPFMLMGLGVDDIFVIMVSWDQVNSFEHERRRSLPERIALTLSHAGTTICITSLTDVVAFVIGSSTILPSLQSFCIYAAVGVLVTFLLQITFFVAFFTLDARRIEAKRNGIIPCIVHEDFIPLSERPAKKFHLSDKIYSNVVLTRYGKVGVLIVTMAIAAVAIRGTTQLEQRFDPEWFLPEESYLGRYTIASNREFPQQGEDGMIFMGEMDYAKNFPQILSLSRNLTKYKTLRTVENWPARLERFIRVNYEDKDPLNLTTDEFQNYLSLFLFSKSGGKYQKNFRFEESLRCGVEASKIKVASIAFSFAAFTEPFEWIAAMDEVKEVCARADIDGFVTAWSEAFGNWVTDKVIADEVIRNLILALVCVMGMTLLLIAEIQTCFWILICVLLTLLDVCGFMYYWGLTVDIVSCIGLELAVGLSVDYAAHVAHAFLSCNISTDRTARVLQAVKHIGSAVLYGAGSTLLALSLLATSEAYVFRSFFKIFLLVIVFGIWHGLVFLPVVLSLVGPRSLHELKSKFQPDAKSTNQELEQIEPLNEPNSLKIPRDNKRNDNSNE